MKKLYTYALRYAWILIGVIVCSFPTACQQSDELGKDADKDEYETYHIHLLASASGGFSTTRAVEEPDNTYLEPGSAAEDAINPSDYKILLFNNKGNYIKEVDNGTWNINKAETDGVQITGTFKTLPTNMTDKVQIMVLANWDVQGFNERSYRAYPKAENDNVLTIQDICYPTGTSGSYRVGLECSSNHFMPNSTNRFIPMFGLSKKIEVTGNEIHFTGNNSVKMLRSLAKIEVIDKLSSPGYNDYAITKCELVSYNYWGRFTPDIKLLNESLDDVTGISITNNPSLRNGTVAGLEKVDDGTGITKYLVYVQEMNIPQTGNNAIRIYMNNNNNTPAITIYLRDYTDNILRNHIYRFIIKTDFEDPEPEPGVSFWVYPWIKASSTNITFD